MPQLDFVTFFSQFFWLVVIFLGFYLVLAKYYLPRIARTKKLRESLQRGAGTHSEYEHRLSENLRYGTLMHPGSNSLCTTGLYWHKSKQEADEVFTRTKGRYASRYSRVFIDVLRAQKKAAYLILPLVTQPHRFAQLSKRYFLTHAMRRNTRKGVRKTHAKTKKQTR